jgi:hypothetical protein
MPPDPSEHRKTRHHGWLYTRLPVPASDLALSRSYVLPPLEIGGMPLVRHEELAVRWRSYAEYLSNLYAGEAGLLRLQALLRDALSPTFLSIAAAPPPSVRLRMWWMDDAPEVQDIPWESLVFGRNRPPQLSFVRGRPPASVPPLPLAPGQPITVAVFDPAGLAPEPLRGALQGLGPAVAVRRLVAEDPREALREAARAGVEAVHLVADASVPLGLDGFLDFPGGATLDAMEAGHLLCGSRVALLALSAPAAPHLGRDGLPTVFHGFARFGHAIGAGLTLIAPLGPLAPPELARFWRRFYERFAEVLDVEGALIEATPCPIRTPLVLFLRHRFGSQFYRSTNDPGDVCFDPGDGAGAIDPAHASADLAVSADLLHAAMAVRKHYAALGVKFPGEDLLEGEHERQRALAAYIDSALSQRRDQ